MTQGNLLSQPEEIFPDLWLLPQFTSARDLRDDLQRIAQVAPFRHMMTHTGYPTAAAMTNCGDVGWTSEAGGYFYRERDPQSGKPWPAMPHAWRELAQRAAAIAGYADYDPDICLVNQYAVGAGMGRHVDNSERDFSQPIVSVSLGLPTNFSWWGREPSGAGRNLLLQDGDVLVWGRSARLGYHAVRPLPAGTHPVCGAFRYNLTFRRAR
ncbi:MAG: alpha-ketoglutarate-dependent dioxygenase AlkB [Pseudomonadota bacterium]